MATDKEIRACQIEDLRKLINEARAACAIGAIPKYNFSDDPIVPGKTIISIKHVDEIKDAVKEISTKCGPMRPETNFNAYNAGDLISTANYVHVFNSFVGTGFCGDSICQSGFEDLVQCGVDCGGSAQFYCNGIGGCYAGAVCPSGKKCYSVLQDCLNNVAIDCAPCTPDCTGKETKGSCDSWPDGCGGLCWGTNDNKNCDCAKDICVGNTCVDSCGNVCSGTKLPDLSCASQTCPSQACSDGCGGLVIGTGSNCPCATYTFYDDRCIGTCGICLGTKLSTEKPYQKCGDNSSVYFDGVTGSYPTLIGYYIYRCVGVCTPADADKISPLVGVGQPWADTSISVGQTYSYARKPQFSDSIVGSFNLPKSITIEVNPGVDCSCASSTYFDSKCDNTCGGNCLGTMQRSISVLQECSGQASVKWTAGDYPTMDGYYVYRCVGNCIPKEADKISSLVGGGSDWNDTNVVLGETYTYAVKPHFIDQDPGVFSQKKTVTIGTGVSSCSCAGSTCQGKTCIDSCGKSCSGQKIRNCNCASSTCEGSFCADNCGDGTYCAGTMKGDCSCASNTCVGRTCVNSCGGASCAGTKRPDCSCASDTCLGSTCPDGCGGTCAGTKSCSFAPIECKKYTCSPMGFCLQDHTQTCSCPSGYRPACFSAPSFSCGTNTCPDTVCNCVP